MTALLPLLIAIIDPGDGIVLAPPIELTKRGDAPSVTADPTGAIAAWRTRASGKTCIVAARLDAGARPGPPIELACPKVLGGGPAIAAGANGSLIVWAEGDELVGMMLSATLKATPAFRIAQDSTNVLGLSIASDGTRFWVAWANCLSALVLEVDASGRPVARAHMLNAPQTQAFGRFTRDAYVACSGAACEVQYTTTDAPGLDGVLDERVSCATHYAAAPQKFTSQVHAVPIRAGQISAAPGAGTIGGLASLGTKPLVATDLSQRPTLVRAVDGVAGTLIAAQTFYNDEKFPLGIQFVHRGATSTRHAPIELPGEAAPAVASLGAERYVLVTTTRAGAIVARAVAIKADRFITVPPSRPPLVRGTVKNSRNQPAAGAQLYCVAQRGDGCGSSVTPDAQGNFTIEHPTPDDHRAVRDITVAAVLAFEANEGAVARPVLGRPIAITLVRPATIEGTIRWPGKTPVPRPPQPEPSGGANRPLPPRDPAIVDVHSITALLIAPYTNGYYGGDHGTTSFRFDAIAPGVAELQGFSGDGTLGFATLVPVESGKTVRADVTLAKVGPLRIEVSGAGPVQVQSGNVGFACEPRGAVTTCSEDVVAPGTHLLHVLSGRWVMTRSFKALAGQTTTVRLAFEADIPAGNVGLELAASGLEATIVSVAPGTRGMVAGGKIVAIDGAAPSSADDARARLSGTPGSKVVVEISGAGGKLSKITLERSRGPKHGFAIAPLAP